MARAGTRLIDRPEFKTKPKPVTFFADDKVSEAISIMSEKNYGSVIIVDKQEKVIGVVTERDIVKKLVNVGLSAKNTKLEKIMTRNPRVANENDNVIDWLRIMSNDRFRRLPVVDEKNRIKVIFTQGDFVSYTWPDLIYQASQMAKSSFMRGFSINSLLIFMLVYAVAIFATVRAFIS
ncbi:CBS domain-containing protein [Alphaproteobacteria bacterium]|nr:CBS domain-containing protein [Alphaproteobacteria bacterium]